MQQKTTTNNEYRLLAPFHGPALKAVRQTMGYTQEAFAAASGIGSRAFVNRLERPDAKPDRDTILRIVVFVDDYLTRRPEMRALVYRCIRDNMIDPENDWVLFQYPTLQECWTRLYGLQLPPKPDLERMASMAPSPYRFFLDVEKLPTQAFETLHGLEQRLQDNNDQHPLSFQITQWQQLVVVPQQVAALEQDPRRNKAVLTCLERLKKKNLLFYYESPGKKDLSLPEVLDEYQSIRLSNWAASQNGPAALLTGSEEQARVVAALNVKWPLAQVIRILYFETDKGFLEWQPETEG